MEWIKQLAALRGDPSKREEYLAACERVTEHQLAALDFFVDFAVEEVDSRYCDFPIPHLVSSAIGLIRDNAVDRYDMETDLVSLLLFKEPVPEWLKMAPVNEEE